MSSTLHDRPVTSTAPQPGAAARPPRPWLRVGLLLAVVAVAAVSATTFLDATGETTSPETATVAASLSDFAIDLGVAALQPGSSVAFDVVNDGKLPHDLAIVDGPATPVLNAGEVASLTYQVGDAGAVRMICTVPGHEAAGMFLTVPITPASP